MSRTKNQPLPRWQQLVSIGCSLLCIGILLINAGSQVLHVLGMGLIIISAVMNIASLRVRKSDPTSQR